MSPAPHSHFEHFVFFLAFGKAKNAHLGRGSPIRSNVQKNNVFYVQARQFIVFCTSDLNSYQEKNFGQWRGYGTYKTKGSYEPL